MRQRVVVMMPFGGRSREDTRRAILDFLRIKYVLSNPEVRGPDVTFDVTVMSLQAGNIQVRGVEEVLHADATICMLTEENVNVAFELAVRCLRDVPILVVKGDPDRLVPVYLRDYAYIRYEAPPAVEAQMTQLATGEFPILDWESEIPDSLRQAIDAHDSTMIENMRVALKQRARDQGARPFIKDLMVSYAAEEAVSDLVRKGLYQRWTTYAPSSTVEIRWKAQSASGEYKLDDMEGEPRVIDYNDDFSGLYNFEHGFSQHVLTQAALIQKLQSFVDPDNFRAFIEDQRTLTEQIVLRGGYARTEVALHINENHPRPGFRNRSFMPCLVGKHVAAVDLSAPHSVYLIVMYADVTEVEQLARARS